MSDEKKVTAEVSINADADAVWRAVSEGEEVKREIVPATREKGAHFNPTIAYDAQTGMLFAFWIHNSSMLVNQLMNLDEVLTK